MKIRLIHNNGTLKDLFEKCKEIVYQNDLKT